MDIDWAELFLPRLPLLEIFIRGTCVYLVLFAYFRLLRRSAGGLGVTDIILVVLVADAAQNAMAGEDHAILSGLLTVATIAFWDFALDWLAWRFPKLEAIVRAPPRALVRNGRIDRKAMRKEMVTDSELEAQLRQNGVDDVADVKRATLEGDGRVSVVKRDGGDSVGADARKPAPGVI